MMQLSEWIGDASVRVAGGDKMGDKFREGALPGIAALSSYLQSLGVVMGLTSDTGQDLSARFDGAEDAAIDDVRRF